MTFKVTMLTCPSDSNRLVSKIGSAISDPAGFLKDQLKLHAVDTLELCLVCEVCWRPQRDGAYDVTKKSDLCAKVRACSRRKHTLCDVCVVYVWHR